MLIVSDIERIEIHTNFTGLKPVVTTITPEELASDNPSRALFILRDVFAAPEEFRPRIEQAQITEKAAKHFAEIARSLAARGHELDKVAHLGHPRTTPAWSLRTRMSLRRSLHRHNYHYRQWCRGAADKVS